MSILKRYFCGAPEASKPHIVNFCRLLFEDENIIFYCEQLTCLDMGKNYFYCEQLNCSLKFAVSEELPQDLSLAKSAKKGLMLFHRPHICHGYHRLYLWRKFCHVEKFQISVKNLNKLWRFIEIYQG